MLDIFHRFSLCYINTHKAKQNTEHIHVFFFYLKTIYRLFTIYIYIHTWRQFKLRQQNILITYTHLLYLHAVKMNSSFIRAAVFQFHHMILGEVESYSLDVVWRLVELAVFVWSAAVVVLTAPFILSLNQHVTLLVQSNGDLKHSQ